MWGYNAYYRIWKSRPVVEIWSLKVGMVWHFPGFAPWALLERAEYEVNIKNALLSLRVIYEWYSVVKHASSAFEKTSTYPSLQLFLSLVTWLFDFDSPPPPPPCSLIKLCLTCRNRYFIGECTTYPGKVLHEPLCAQFVKNILLQICIFSDNGAGTFMRGNTVSSNPAKVHGLKGFVFVRT